VEAGIMRKFKALIAGLLLFFGLSSCSGTEQVIGTHSSPNNGSVEITAFDGDEGEFKAYGITLARLNDEYSYTTPSNSIEIFAIARSYSNDDQLIMFSIDGVAYIATFSFNDMTIKVEGTIYAIQR
jgi:hypothetical protein